MLSEEEMAINRLECGNTAHSKNADYIQLAIKALKKQVPMKPKEINEERIKLDAIFDWSCGNCGRFHRNDYPLNYCSECGQKVDWSDSN